MGMSKASAPLVSLLLLFWLGCSQFRWPCIHVEAAFSINHYLGSCLTQEWVDNMALQVNLDARDVDGQKVFPFIEKAVAKGQPRFQIDDPRTSSSHAFKPSCFQQGITVFGPNALFDVHGRVTDMGQINGSLVIEFDDWTSHSLTSTVFMILAGEVLGYPISEFHTFQYDSSTERMSSVNGGVCFPVHVDMEVWSAGIQQKLQLYANESYCAGGVGYMGRSGVYITTNTLKDGLNGSRHHPPFSADFWKDYKFNEQLIHALAVSELTNNAKYYPPPPSTTPICDDGVLGCKDKCSKTYACTRREQAGKECLVVAMGYYGADAGYAQAVFANNEIPAYFCFLGINIQVMYAADMQSQNRAALFYHYEPSDYANRLRGFFERVYLPNPTDDRVALATGTFGELGYGQPTLNPVDVDFPSQNLAKYGANLLLDNPPIATLFSRFELTQSSLEELMDTYVAKTPDVTHIPNVNKVFFDTACDWIKNNHPIWSQWIDPLPSCTLDDIHYVCQRYNHSISRQPVSHLSFHWIHPQPTDPSKSYTCEGGITSLPLPLDSHLTCQELYKEPISWFFMHPTCDASYYFWTLTDCDFKSGRTISYEWIVPLATNLSQSSECDGELPHNDRVDCDYFPTISRAYFGMCLIVAFAMGYCIVLMVTVARYQDAPFLRYGNAWLLQMINLGGLLVSGFVYVQAGEPTAFLCGLRRIFLIIGLNCILSSLLVKSLFTFQVSICSSFKRKKRIQEIYKRSKFVFLVLTLIDATFVAVWFTIDYPAPKVFLREYTKLAITEPIPDHECSQNYLFAAVSLFWKVGQALVGLALSFHCRRVDFDFGGEWFWLATSNAAILAIGLLIVIVALGISLPRISLYVCGHLLVLLCPLVVASLMVVPKVMQAKALKSPAPASNGNSLNSIVPGMSSSTTKPKQQQLTSVLPPSGNALAIHPLEKMDDDHGPSTVLLPNPKKQSLRVSSCPDFAGQHLDTNH